MNRIVPLSLFAALLGLPARLPAQDEPAIVLKVEIAGQGKTLSPLRPLDLRPNASTEFGVELKNTHTEKLNNVTATLVQIDDMKRVRPLAVGKLPALGPGEKSLLAFEEIKGLKKGPLPGNAPFKLQLHIDAAKAIGFEPIKLDLKLSIAEPSNYILQSAQFTAKSGKPRLKIEATDDIKSPPPHNCPVEIVLGPEFVPTKKGNLSETLDRPKQIADLFADGLMFAGKAAKGRVYLKVDGYDRAFTYDVTLAGEGTVSRRQFVANVGARVLIKRYLKPDAKFVVPLELDGPLSDDYRVEVALDRTGEKERFSEVRKLVGLRQKAITVAVGPAKHLVLQNEVRDWQPQFNTAGLYGDLWLRVQVFDTSRKDPSTGGPRQETLDLSAAPLPGLAKPEIDPTGKTLYVRVTQDDSAAEDIAFASLPKDAEWPTGQKLPLTIIIKKRDVNQAPIDKVVLVRGKAPKEKEEIKPDDLFGKDEAPPEAKAEWMFTVPPQTKAGPLVVTAQFTTKTGVVGSKTETIHIYDPKDKKAAKTLATIKGSVKHGELVQPGKEVILTDGKKKEIAKTDAKGAFVFKDVPPGTYAVVVTFSDVATFSGMKAVEVKEGTKAIDLGTISVLEKGK